MPLFELTRQAPDGEALRLTLEPQARLAVIGAGPAERQRLALAAAGLMPEGTAFDGTLLLAGAAYPVTEKQLAQWRGRRIGYLGPPKPASGDGTVDSHTRLILGAKADTADVRQRAGLVPEDGQRPLAALTRAQQQRLRLAMVLWTAPELVVALDPVAGLDPWEAANLFDRVKAAGCAVLMFTDDAAAARALDGEIAVLQAGRIIERGPQQKMTDAGQQEATRHLLVPEKRRSWTMARPPIGGDLLEGRGIETDAFPGRAVDLTLRRGETLGVLGEAGAGKLALLRVIARLDPARAGTIRLDRVTYSGSDAAAPARTGIAFIGRDPHQAFNPELSVGLTLTEPLRVEQQLLVEEQAERLAEAVRAVGLNPDQLDRRPDRFSAADLQRLALARALVGRPILLVLDEPTARLPPEARTNFLLLVQRVRADFGLTVLIASRSFDALRDMSDRIIVLADGAVVESGKPGELAEAAREEITRRLLGYPRPLPPEPAPAPEPEPEPIPVPEPEDVTAPHEALPPAGPGPVTASALAAAPEPEVSLEPGVEPLGDAASDKTAEVAPDVPTAVVDLAQSQVSTEPVTAVFSEPVSVEGTPIDTRADDEPPVVAVVPETLVDETGAEDEPPPPTPKSVAPSSDAVPEPTRADDLVGPPAGQGGQPASGVAEPDPPRERGRPEP